MTAEQSAFHHSDALFRGFVGGRGAGKTWVGAYDLICRADRDRTYMVASPTGVMMQDTTFPTFKSIAQRLGVWGDVRLTPYPTATLTTGATVRFRTAEDPEKMRGPNLSGCWLDEASLMPEGAYTITIACLREGERQGWLSATFTPNGKTHWTYETFAEKPGGSQRENTKMFHCRTSANVFLPTEFEDTLVGQYGRQTRTARQELGGEFLDVAGALFSSAWFKKVPAAPPGLRTVRAWDLAATEAKDSTDPDYTVGTLMGRAPDNGPFYVLDVQRFRRSPLETERSVRAWAEIDGRGVPVVIEREGGASGKILVAHFAALLAGWVVREAPPEGDKVQRARPFAAQAELGNVYLVDGPWVRDWLAEAGSFPEVKHDDQVDSAVHAFRHLTGKKDVSQHNWGTPTR